MLRKYCYSILKGLRSKSTKYFDKLVYVIVSKTMYVYVFILSTYKYVRYFKKAPALLK